MRIASSFFLFLATIGTFCAHTFASSPFEAILSRMPDIAVTDIHQETTFVYMRVCNLGGSLTDSDTSVALAMKKTGGGIIATVEPIILSTNDCHEFRMASLQDLGITTSGTYEISGGAVLKDGKIEKTKDNNKIARSVNIIYPSTYVAPIYSSDTNNNYTNSNYCNLSNNYCSGNNYGSTTYYCIPGTSNCSTVPYSTYNNNTTYCNSSNNYCANNTYNGSTTYYRANICPAYDNACNNSYYNSTNTQYRNNDNEYCTFSNNYCKNHRSDRDSRDCNYNNNYCNNTYNHNHSNDNQYNLPDLVVQKIYQNASDKHIIAQICNQGGDMKNSTSIRTSFVANNTTTTMYSTLQIGNGQCTSSVVYTIPEEINILYNGNISVSATVDSNNNVNERNESNNTLTQNLYIETNRNQKSDLVVDRISYSDNNRTVTTRICNIGDDMLNYGNWIVEIVNTTTNTSIRNSLSRLGKGQCSEMQTTYADLGIYRSGGYNIRASVDSENTIIEQSEWNNTMNQYIQVSGNYYY